MRIGNSLNYVGNKVTYLLTSIVPYSDLPSQKNFSVIDH